MPTPFLTTPANRSAWTAIQDLLHDLTSDPPEPRVNPLYLHGPTGTGKTLLLRTLAVELAPHHVKVDSLSANDLADQDENRLDRQTDLLLFEDLQHLPTRFTEKVVQLIDERLRCRLATIFTASCGPGQLTHRGTPFAHRLTSRLSSGLVVALEPLRITDRRRLLETLTEQKELKIASEILDWLAEQTTGGGRQLEGAVSQLKTLQSLHEKPLRLDDDLRAHFRTQLEANTPTVERIAAHVGDFFRVEPKRLRSDKRTHDVLLPRQVSMYLARQLTSLSLQQIGRFFGGRDHKTVQHACKKVEQAMKTDQTLSGAVRQMHAELA